eukprot:4435749-Heterocapsa_arctica.AAC.1
MEACGSALYFNKCNFIRTQCRKGAGRPDAARGAGRLSRQEVGRKGRQDRQGGRTGRAAGQEAAGGIAGPREAFSTVGRKGKAGTCS